MSFDNAAMTMKAVTFAAALPEEEVELLLAELESEVDPAQLRCWASSDGNRVAIARSIVEVAKKKWSESEVINAAERQLLRRTLIKIQEGQQNQVRFSLLEYQLLQDLAETDPEKIHFAMWSVLFMYEYYATWMPSSTSGNFSLGD